MSNFGVYPIGDLRIQVELQDRLQRAERLARARIAVRVTGGAVTLEGRVFCERDASEAVEAASDVPGVIVIRDELRVEDPGA